MADQTFAARSAFAGLADPRSSGQGISSSQGITVEDRDGVGIAVVHARKGQLDAMVQAVRTHFGIALPDGPRRVSAGNLAFARTAPETWLVTQEGSNERVDHLLRHALAPLVSVTDLSDGFAVLHLTGPHVRDTLAKLVPIDLHPQAFREDDVATTSAAHVGVTLVRLPDQQGQPVFEIFVFRSLAASFWHALRESAAEFAAI